LSHDPTCTVQDKFLDTFYIRETKLQEGEKQPRKELSQARRGQPVLAPYDSDTRNLRTEVKNTSPGAGM
jgi:hypothetical protein